MYDTEPEKKVVVDRVENHLVLYDSFPPQIKYNSFLRTVWREVYHKNSNFIIVILGKPGSGKSLDALGIAYDFDRNTKNEPTFSAFHQVYFTLEDFMFGVEKSKKRGKVHILDEAGISESLQSRNFMSFDNKTASSFLQTIRVKGQVLIFCLSSGNMLDNQARILSHADIIAYGHDKKKAWGVVKLHDDDMWKGVPYRKYPQSKIAGEKYQWRSIHFDLPPKALVDSYEWWQKIMKAELQKGWSNEMAQRRKDKKAKLSTQELYKKVKENLQDFLTPDKKRVSTGLIEGYFSEKGIPISHTSASSISVRVNRELKYQLEKGIENET